MVSTPSSIDTQEIFDALEAFILQRPRLDPANYGLSPGQTPNRQQWQDALRCYRQEVRAIGRDRHRALTALEEARGLTPQRGELLLGAFRAFSGRLQWKRGVDRSQCAYNPCTCHDDSAWQGNVYPEGCSCGCRWGHHLEYTTGQYWPTEYRKAAAAVLAAYIADWRQAEASQHPQTFTYQTMDDVRSANRKIGNHWFDRGTLKFFNTKIESGLIGGRYFITSERYDETQPRLYSIRIARPDGTIGTVGDFQGYTSREDAREAVRGIVKGEGQRV